MVRLWDVTAGKERRRLEVDKRAVLSLVLSPDGRVLASGGYNDPTIRLWDVAGGKELRRLNAKGAALAVAFSADGRVLVSTNDAGEQGVTVHRWEVATGKELRQWPNSLRGRSLSADGRLLATSDYRDPAIRLWDTATGREYRKFVSPEGKGSAAAVAFSHDGRTVACGIGIEGVIHLWEVATGAECSRLQGHQTFIRDLAFSPDGRKLVSGSSDTTALLWDLTGLNGADRARLKLSAEVLDRLWTDLAGDDGVRAYQAIWRLATDPQAAVPYVRQRLQPASPADPQRLARLITDLDSKRFTVRQRAVEELEKLDDLAEPALRRALEGKPSLEFRRQAEEILRRLAGPVNDPAKRRALRAIEMLEYAGTPEARALLTDLAKGTPDLRLTREAKAALERLARRR
jgi:WD40 repeat protein